MKNIEIAPEHKDLIKTIGAKIRELRKEKGISYSKIAEEMGISRNGYNNLELAKTNFQFLTLLRVLSYHKISVFDFFESLKTE